jgi:hypothetical protein
MPSLENLERLDLNDNFIDSGLSVLVERFPNLKILKLSNNRIKHVKEVESLTGLRSLLRIDFSDNPMSEPAFGNDLIDTKYYKSLREKLNQVQVVDRYNRAGDYSESDPDEYDMDDETEQWYNKIFDPDHNRYIDFY